MRVLQFNSAFGGGGVDSATFDLCVGLAQAGDEVWVAGGVGRPLTEKSRGIPGITTLDIPYRDPYASVWRLAKLIREHDIQIVHAHQGEDYWAAILAALLSGRFPRVVISRHLMTRPSAMSRTLLLRFAHVAAVSKAVWVVLDANLLGSRKKLHQAYPGIDTERFRPSRSEALRAQLGWGVDTIGFGLVGRFVSVGTKGNLDFVDAAAIVHAEIPQARFVLVGEMNLGKSQIAEVIRVRGLSEVIKVLPFSNEVLPVLNALDVLVHPPAGNEALGLVLVEALACEKPVIATRLDGIPETFIDGEHGLLVPPKNPEALATAMKKLALDAALRTRFGKAGRSHAVKNFDRRAYAERMRALYAGIL
ncbi:MAG: glycosyltransferase family 4 protein [Pseudomonadota bacterium]